MILRILVSLVIVSILGLIGCNPYAIKPPNNLISRDTVVMVYRDMVLSDARFTKNLFDDSVRALMYAGELNTLRKYGISQVQFDSSIKFYRLNEDDMEDIISDVIQQLNKEQVTIENRLKDAEKEKLEQSDE